MNTFHRTRFAQASIAALMLAGSIDVNAQQGFDQAPGYPPAGTAQPSYPTGHQMPPPNPSNYPGNPGPNQMPPPAQMPGGLNPGSMNPGATGMQGNAAQAIVQMEMQDYGVPPQQQLQANMHGPTPTSIPGGQVVTTDRLLSMYQHGMQSGGLLVFHVLGPGPTLPMAQNAVGAAQAGDFQDQTQQQFGQYLQQVTQGNKSVPMVFYCQSTQCWMSYNAALRAINMGYTQVHWYRGGIEAWQAVQNMAMNMQPQGGMQQGGQMPMPQQQPSGYQNAGYQPQPGQGGW